MLFEVHDGRGRVERERFSLSLPYPIVALPATARH
jgi:hypothetical protein